MKNILLIIALLVAATTTQAQASNADSLIAAQARQLAIKLKDSLQLNKKQTEDLYQINLQLAKQKKAAFLLPDRASTGKQLQSIENSRDSLYGTVLNAAKLEAYKRKKAQWLSKPRN